MITKADVAAVRTAATLHAGDPDNGRLARELNRAAERMEDQLFLESRPLHAS